MSALVLHSGGCGFKFSHDQLIFFCFWRFKFNIGSKFNFNSSNKPKKIKIRPALLAMPVWKSQVSNSDWYHHLPHEKHQFSLTLKFILSDEKSLVVATKCL
jgi:hypothetical protein